MIEVWCSMLEITDFIEKQIILVYARDGDKISVLNDNILIKDLEGKIKCHATCYRLFAIFIIGQTTLTTALIDRAKKFGFEIILFTSTFRIYEVIGFRRDANMLLHRKQYEYNSMEIAKHLTKNKIINQASLLRKIRGKSQGVKDAILKLDKYCEELSYATNVHELMGYEGSASRLYFKELFNEFSWRSRCPRIKNDYINSLLDIGYTVLFAYIEAMLNIYGFDVYCGVMHTEFYMRKSLVCDLMEPFRSIIDAQIRKSLFSGQFKKEDFREDNHRFVLEFEKSSEYVAVFLSAILTYKKDIFLYVRQYYRSFMKNANADEFPIFEV